MEAQITMSLNSGSSTAPCSKRSGSCRARPNSRRAWATSDPARISETNPEPPRKTPPSELLSLAALISTPARRPLGFLARINLPPPPRRISAAAFPAAPQDCL
ncbi:hypothetical protein NL676_014611 [Syzygium grande]|nr:hypothetical protein NL676_014611 [Syzygium grande]